MQTSKIVLCALLLAAAGCAHEESDERVVATATTPAVGQPQHLDYALTHIRESDQALTVDGYTVSRADDAVLITRGAYNRENVAGIDAGMVTANIASRLSSDPTLRGIPIHVEADDTGLVKLDGRVPSVAQAQRAIEDCFAVPGVLAVQSRLAY